MNIPSLNSGPHDIGRHASAKSIVILMADDDADDRLLAKDALAECKLPGELHFVENGEELLDYLNRRGRFTQMATSPRPGLILLDLNMPKKDGREALREIKNNPDLRKIPVVVLTTSTADGATPSTDTALNVRQKPGARVA